MAEIVGLCAGGNHQVVIPKARGLTTGLKHGDGAARQVDVGGLGQKHRDIALSTQHGAQGRCDLTGGPQAGRYLVGQRLEQVMIGPIDNRDVHRRVSKTPDHR